MKEPKSPHFWPTGFPVVCPGARDMSSRNLDHSWGSCLLKRKGWWPGVADVYQVLDVHLVLSPSQSCSYILQMRKSRFEEVK